MTESAPRGGRSDRPAAGARRVVLAGSSLLFVGIMAALPMAAGGSGVAAPVVALPYRPVSVAATATAPPATAAPQPRRIVRIIRIVVLRHHTEVAANLASASGSPPPKPVAPVRVAASAPPPAPAPAPAPVATSSGSH